MRQSWKNKVFFFFFMQQGVQTDATCNIQQCWELLVNNVASVFTQPKLFA